MPEHADAPADPKTIALKTLTEICQDSQADYGHRIQAAQSLLFGGDEHEHDDVN